LHVGSDEPHHVEGADKVDVDDALEFGERHRSVAADDALAGPTPAQLIRMRAAPNCSRASRTAALDCSALVTSHWSAWPPIFCASARRCRD